MNVVVLVFNLIGIAIVSCKVDVQLFFSRQFLIDDISTKIFRTLIDLPIDKCVRQCNHTKTCSFVNYQRRTHLCFLIEQVNHKINATMFISPGYVSSDLTPSKQVSNPCQRCSHYESCYDGVCAAKGCPLPNPPEWIQTYGNVYSTGSRLAYGCKGAHYPDPIRITYITCLVNGTWTDRNISCCTDTNLPFETGILPSGMPVAFLVIPEPKSNSGAKDFCLNICARLLKLTTDEKFIFFQKVMKRPENSADGYWVDGERTDFFGPWFTSTGDPLPPENNTLFWFKSNFRCIRADKNNDYRFNGKWCFLHYAFICEK